jgi:archaeal flagellar protein FlaI
VVLLFLFNSSKEGKKIPETEMHLVLGFGLNKVKEIRTLSKRKKSRIIHSAENENIYVIDFPLLSGEESWLAKQVLNEFRKTYEKNKKNFSVKKCIEFFLNENNLIISKNQKEYLNELIELTAFKSGLLEFFLEDELIEEITLNGLGKENPLFVFHINFGWIKTNLFYSNEEETINLINKLSRKNKRQISLHKPKLNAVLENGNRLNAVIKPVSNQPSITIRKFKNTPLTVFDLIQSKTVSSEAIAFLELALKTDLSILICGNTGSGKTTFLNSIFCFIPKNERIIIIEETQEIKIPHEHKVMLSTAEGINETMNSLIINSLRMRPDRVIVGEIRSKEEINSFIDTILAGQGRGSFATFHAQTSKEALKRLKLSGVNEQDLNSIDLIISLRRITKARTNSNAVEEKRRILEITELNETKNKIELNQLFEFDYEKDYLKKKNKSIRIMNKLKECFGLNETEIIKQINKRKKEFESSKKTNKFIELTD